MPTSMDTTITFLTAQHLGLIPVIVALVTVAKATGLPTRIASLTSLVLGLALSFLIPAATLPLTILAGLVIGLTASGAYSGVKSTVIG